MTGKHSQHESDEKATMPPEIAALIECGGTATRDELDEVMDVKVPGEISDLMRRHRYNGIVTFRDGAFHLTDDYTAST